MKWPPEDMPSPENRTRHAHFPRATALRARPSHPAGSSRLAALAAVVIALSASTSVTACTDKAKLSAAQATAHVDALATLTDKDVTEIERGMPLGAAKLQALYAKKGDPHQDLPAARTALLRMRRDVPDLTVAKSTFFALADDRGIAIRNDLEEDAMAGQNLVALFPDLARAEAGSYVATTGKFAGLPPPTGPDKDWVAAVPVKRDDGSVAGILVTGWTFRRFAHHLQETLKHDLQEEQANGKLPVLYVALFDGSGVYSAPLTPEVNDKTLADLDLLGKTATGPARGTLTITDREFGYAARRAPKLGPDIGLVVLRSEL
jgi:hypothetical protein